jgi:RNA 3'-terminal phosphate cyclase
VIIGGKDLEHDCGLQRGIGYFLEPLILLGLFGRSPLSIRLKGIVTDTPLVIIFCTKFMVIVLLSYNVFLF